MAKVLASALFLFFLSGCAADIAEFRDNVRKLGKEVYGKTWNTSQGPIKQDAYGPGVHQDQYGRPVKLRTQQGPTDPTMRIQQPDAYGPTVHMDQYGRPIQTAPRW